MGINIYIYLGLGSYQLTIIERNGGVGCKGNSRVVEKSSLRIANMNSKGLSDCESNLLEGVDRWCWGGVGVSVELPCLCEFPIMVGVPPIKMARKQVHFLLLTI